MKYWKMCTIINCTVPKLFVSVSKISFHGHSTESWHFFKSSHLIKMKHCRLFSTSTTLQWKFHTQLFSEFDTIDHYFRRRHIFGVVVRYVNKIILKLRMILICTRCNWFIHNSVTLTNFQGHRIVRRVELNIVSS